MKVLTEDIYIQTYKTRHHNMLHTNCKILPNNNEFWRNGQLWNPISLNSTPNHSTDYIRALLHSNQHAYAASLWEHRQKPSSHRNLQGSTNNISCLLNLHNYLFLRCNQSTCATARQVRVCKVLFVLFHGCYGFCFGNFLVGCYLFIYLLEALTYILQLLYQEKLLSCLVCWRTFASSFWKQ